MDIDGTRRMGRLRKIFPKEVFAGLEKMLGLGTKCRKI